MQIGFGVPVYGVGGKHLGEVDGVIVNAGTKRARAILIDAGRLGGSKHILEVSAIKSAGADGVRLETTGAQSAAQSQVLDSEEVAFPQRVTPPTTFIPAAGVGGPIVADEPAIPGDYPDNSSFFDIAPIDPPPVEIESDLMESDAVLGKDTHAISADGDQLGEVVTLDLGDMGLVEKITVAEGFIFKHRADFSLVDINEFGKDAIYLRLTKAEAESR